jgi:hypothetical protein
MNIRHDNGHSLHHWIVRCGRAPIYIDDVKRQAPAFFAIPPHDYSRALQSAVSWLGDRYLLSTPQARTTKRPRYWTAAQHAAAYQDRTGSGGRDAQATTSGTSDSTGVNLTMSGDI